MSEDPLEPSSSRHRAEQNRQELPTAQPTALSSNEAQRERSTAARIAGVGLQFAITLLVGLGVGTWLDRKFGTAPVFLYIGVFLGAGAAFYSMYRQLMANLEREEAAKRARKAGQSSPPPSSES